MSEANFWDREAEMAVLKSCFRHPEAAGDAVELGLKASHFSTDNALIFGAIVEVSEGNSRLTVNTVARHLAAQDKLAAAGGNVALMDIANSGNDGVAFYGRLVLDRAAVRREVTLVQAHLSALTSPGIDPSVQMASFRDALLSGDASEIRSDGPRSIREVIENGGMEKLDEWIANPHAIRGIRTGHAELDRLMGGLAAGRMSVWGASTSAGKTQWMQHMARMASIGGAPSLLLSTEMSAEDNLFRWAFQEAGFDRIQAERKGLDDSRKKRLIDGIYTLSERPIHVWEMGGMDLPRIKVAVRRVRSRHGIKLVLLDLMNGVALPDSKHGENLAQAMGKLMAGLHDLAAGEDFHLMTTAHINRAAMQKSEYLGLNDFRDSGAVEQWADQAIMLMPVNEGGAVITREQANADSSQFGFVRVVANLCKNRFGSLGMVNMRLDWDAGGKFMEPRGAA